MSNTNKILACVIGSVMIICLTVICVVNITNKKQAVTTQPVEASQTNPSAETTTTAAEPDFSVTTTQSEVQSPVTTTAAADDLRSQLIGKWSDSAGMSGYEFLADGSVKMTYVNLAAFNIPFDGKADGVYILEGDKLTIKFSIYTATIENSYTISIDGKMLSMYNLEERETSTYSRVGEGEAVTTSATTEATTVATPAVGIVGTWTNADGTTTYTFDNSGTLTAVLCDADGSNCTTNEGLYLSQDDSLVIQHTQHGNSITKSYTWSIVSDVLTVTDEDGRAEMFTRIASADTQKPVSNAEALYGKWSDSAQMSGYEFLNDGTVNVKYVDFTVPVLNIPISTSVPGVYTVNGDEVTVTHSIYGATISTTYRFSVLDKVLTLVNTDDGNTSTYIKKD